MATIDDERWDDDNDKWTGDSAVKGMEGGVVFFFFEKKNSKMIRVTGKKVMYGYKTYN